MFKLSWWLPTWGTLCKVRLLFNLLVSNYFRLTLHVDTLVRGSSSALTKKTVLSYTRVLLGLNKKCQIRVKLSVHCKKTTLVFCASFSTCGYALIEYFSFYVLKMFSPSASPPLFRNK